MKPRKQGTTRIGEWVVAGLFLAIGALGAAYLLHTSALALDRERQRTDSLQVALGLAYDSLSIIQREIITIVQVDTLRDTVYVRTTLPGRTDTMVVTEVRWHVDSAGLRARDSIIAHQDRTMQHRDSVYAWRLGALKAQLRAQEIVMNDDDGSGWLPWLGVAAAVGAGVLLWHWSDDDYRIDTRRFQESMYPPYISDPVIPVGCNYGRKRPRKFC